MRAFPLERLWKRLSPLSWRNFLPLLQTYQWLSRHLQNSATKRSSSRLADVSGVHRKTLPFQVVRSTPFSMSQILILFCFLSPNRKAFRVVVPR